MPDALPAVTEPSLLKAGRRLASVSRVVSGLGCSSRDAVNGLRPPTSTSTISSAKAACASAVAARRCDSTANSSCCPRETPYLAATFSAVTPMWMSWNGSVSIMTVPSTSVRLPSR